MHACMYVCMYVCVWVNEACGKVGLYHALYKHQSNPFGLLALLPLCAVALILRRISMFSLKWTYYCFALYAVHLHRLKKSFKRGSQTEESQGDELKQKLKGGHDKQFYILLLIFLFYMLAYR